VTTLDRVVTAVLPVVPRPIVRWVARPYIAGETLADGVRVVRELNQQGLLGALAVLGEFVERREEVEAAARDVEELLAAVARERLDAYVHVKLSHFGLKLDPALGLATLRRLLAVARSRGLFVRIDMEDSSCTDATLEMFDVVRREFDNVGIVLQARLKRSLDDARKLAQARANVRVCKGIYVEPPAIADQDPERVRANFMALVEHLLGAGSYVAIATHDDRLVLDSMSLVGRMKLDRNRYEFQMLLGVRPPLRRSIRDAGHRLRVAVPYGPQWYAYSLRRFRENPAMAGHVMKAFFSRG
jgi:proline dehydrogenase